MTSERRPWYILHLSTVISMVPLTIWAATVIYDCIEDIYHGPEWDPVLDIINIGIIVCVVAGATTLVEWLIRRYRPKIHLSTALLLMLLAGECIWLNVRPATIQYVPEQKGRWHVKGRGWPIECFDHWAQDYKHAQDEITRRGVPYEVWRENGILCMAMLFIVGFVLEWQIGNAKKT